MAGTLFSDAVIQFFVNTKQAESTLDAFSRKFDQGISRMRNMVLGFIGVKGLYGYYQTLEKVVDTADRWSLPVEKVSQFTNAFSQFGGTAEEAADSIEKLQSLANNLKFHSSGAFRELSAILGVNLQNKDFQGAIDALRKGMQGLNADAKAEVISMLGVNSTMARMLMAEDGVYNTAIKKSKEFGVITEDTAEKIRNMRKSIAEIKQAFLEIAVPLMDIIKPVLNVVRDLVVWFGKLDPEVQKAIMIGFLSIKFLGRISSLTAGLTGLGTALSAAGAGLSAFVVAGAALAGTIYAADKAINRWQDVIDLKKAMKELEDDPYLAGPKQLEGESQKDYNQRLVEWYRKRKERREEKEEDKYNRMWLTHPTIFHELGLDNPYFWQDRNKDGRKDYTHERYEAMVEAIKEAKSGGGKWSDAARAEARKEYNITQNFNIYGVQGAEDLMEQMRSLVQNNIPPITYKMD